MRRTSLTLSAITAFLITLVFVSVAYTQDLDVDALGKSRNPKNDPGVQVGPRPFYLVQGMDNGPLKDKLLSCSEGPF